MASIRNQINRKREREREKKERKNGGVNSKDDERRWWNECRRINARKN